MADQRVKPLTKKKVGRPERINWSAVEAAYRAGTTSAASICRDFHISRSAFDAKVKAEGWTRDLTPAVRAATQAAIHADRADDARALAVAKLAARKHQADRINGAVEAAAEVAIALPVLMQRDEADQLGLTADSTLIQDVAAAAALGAAINRKHRHIGQSIMGAAATMLGEIAALAGRPEDVEALVLAAAAGDPLDEQRIRSALSLGSRAKTLDILAAAATKAVAIERKAHGLDDEDKGTGGGVEDLLRSLANKG